MELRGIVLGSRYRLDRRIAAGGMGQVWRAADEVLGRPVAVKLLRPEYAEHPETLERFRSEARHAGALSHPHIARVYDYGHGYDRGDARPFRDPYLVLEYVDGPSLAELIERGPLEASLTRDIIAQAADGLAAAHQARLVHRDIKPGNLLLTSDGRVKVTDFGIAHAAGTAPITAPGIVMGTALYMAPERIAGGPGTPASDLYSLGVVMYECLSGRPPFHGTSAEVMAAHLHLPLPPLPERVPEPLAGLVAKLTAKDPSYRICDGAVLAARLRALEPGGGRRRAGHSLPRDRPEGDPGRRASPGRPRDPGQHGDRDWWGVPYYLIDARQPGGLVSPPAGYLSLAYPAGRDGGQPSPGRPDATRNRDRVAAAIPPASPASARPAGNRRLASRGNHGEPGLIGSRRPGQPSPAGFRLLRPARTLEVLRALGWGRDRRRRAPGAARPVRPMPDRG